MAIKPFKSAMGGHVEVRYGRMTSGQTFSAGSLVAFDNAGTLSAFPADASEALVADLDYAGIGIAANGPGTQAAAATPIQNQIDFRTGALYAAGAWIGYYPADQGNLFITDLFLAAAGGAATAIAVTDRGELYQITALNATDNWGVEQTAGVFGTDVVAKVVDVLDSNYNPVGEIGAGATPIYVVFEIRSH